MATITTNDINKVQLEISSDLLANLLNSGLLHCGDCKCLNANAKNVIWHNLLARSTNTNSHTTNTLNASNNEEEILCA
ncbi:hypothetical protein [Colwellia ponticola]|uniref:Uncharacterized protein n=1 Tax=Colwellia ponticola TaxID=2304625 RepID=A0A8H2JMY7_9GAMM|nr:hypothetical protein [Colwellia ponticola]TMM46035.1 hypothetical protein FCS21_06860 [Colwellia ponticola]